MSDAEGDAREALLARLGDAGLPARLDGRLVLVDLRDESDYDVIRDAVADLGLALIRLERGRHRIEDLFRAAEGSDRVAHR